ncbi:transposase IS605 OrfB, partial [mine drainage metagenome]
GQVEEDLSGVLLVGTRREQRTHDGTCVCRSSDVKTANAAYTSQTCPEPTCGYVSSDNRHGDRFHCRNPHWECNWQGDADYVAAMNLMVRIDDPEIVRFTPYQEVKKILDERFLRRMESRTGARSVPEGIIGNGARGVCRRGCYRSRQDPKQTTVRCHGSGRQRCCRSPESSPHGEDWGDSAAGERKEKECIGMPMFSGAG